MTFKHTPGPWWVDPNYSGDIQAEGTEIASAYRVENEGSTWEIQGPITVNYETQKANARLIAAAPDLLEAGDNLAKVADSKLCTVRELAEAVILWRAAAAKATGESEQ